MAVDFFKAMYSFFLPHDLKAEQNQLIHMNSLQNTFK